MVLGDEGDTAATTTAAADAAAEGGTGESEEFAICVDCRHAIEECMCVCPYCGERDMCECALFDAATGG